MADEAKLADLYLQKEQIRSRDIVDAAVGAAGAAYSEANTAFQKLQTEYNQYLSKKNTAISRRRTVSQIDNPAKYDKLTNEINHWSNKANSLRPKLQELSTTKAQEDKTYRTEIEVNKKQINEELGVINADIKELKLKIANAKNEYEPQLSDEFDGFQGRMAAFDSLKNPLECQRFPWYSPKHYSPTWWAALFISLLFIIIECAPTFMRMMVADGSYEKLLEAEKHKIRVLADKRISDLNDMVNTEVKISMEKNLQRREAEVRANMELMEKIAKTQAELLQTAIDKWREEELAKINENPSAYIKTNNA